MDGNTDTIACLISLNNAACKYSSNNLTFGRKINLICPPEMPNFKFEGASICNSTHANECTSIKNQLNNPEYKSNGLNFVMGNEIVGLVAPNPLDFGNSSIYTTFNYSCSAL
jgi:hypothetical protein